MFNRNKKRKKQTLRKSLTESWKNYKREKAKRKKLQATVSRMRKKVRKDIREEQRTAILKFLKNPFGRKKLSRDEKTMRRHLQYDIIEHRKKLLRNSPSMALNAIRDFLKKQREQAGMLRERFDYSIAPLIRRENSRELRADLMRNALNSTVAFVVAFWVVYFIGQLVTIWTAGFYSIPAMLYSYITDWPLYEFSPLYTRRNLILIFGSGPLACLVIALAAYRAFLSVYKKYPGVRLFLVWMVFHGATMFFAAYIAGVITRTGLVYSSAWIFLSRPYDIEEIIFMVLAVIILVALGFLVTRFFIMASRSSRIINQYIRVYYMLSTVLVPFLLGNLVVYFTNFPKNPLNFMLLQGFSLLMVLPTLVHYNSPTNQQIRIPGKPGAVPIAWMLVIVFAVLSVVIRLFIFPGIQFS